MSQTIDTLQTTARIYQGIHDHPWGLRTSLDAAWAVSTNSDAGDKKERDKAREMLLPLLARAAGQEELMAVVATPAEVWESIELGTHQLTNPLPGLELFSKAITLAYEDLANSGDYNDPHYYEALHAQMDGMPEEDLEKLALSNLTILMNHMDEDPGTVEFVLHGSNQRCEFERLTFTTPHGDADTVVEGLYAGEATDASGNGRPVMSAPVPMKAAAARVILGVVDCVKDDWLDESLTTISGWIDNSGLHGAMTWQPEEDEPPVRALFDARDVTGGIEVKINPDPDESESAFDF